MNSLIIKHDEIQFFPPCCFNCKFLKEKQRYEWICGKGRIFPFKKKFCLVFESVRNDEKCHDENHRRLEDNSTPWGGKRPGSGRKKIDNPKVKWSGFLSPETVHFLKVLAKKQGFQQSQGELIDDAVKRGYFIKSEPL